MRHTKFLTSDDNFLLWASDGSACSQSDTAVSSVLGPIPAAFRLRTPSSLHSEIFGLILALANDISFSSPSPARILTDHLNSVRLLKDACTSILPAHFWYRWPGRAYYKWLLNLLHHAPATEFEYIKAHTGLSDIPSQLNYSADQIAVVSHHFPAYTPLAPVPTFDMDDFTLWSPSSGYVDSNLASFVNNLYSRGLISKFALDHHLRMPSSFYHPHNPPQYPYERAYSAFSAVVQLYARSGQLPVRRLLSSRRLSRTSRCHFGCTSSEDDHHIFVSCSHFSTLHNNAVRDLVSSLSSVLSSIPIHLHPPLLYITRNLFSDDPLVWPFNYSRYYVGLLPPFQHHLPSYSTSSPHNPISTLSNTWHTVSIRLAGRIWGEVFRSS